MNATPKTTKTSPAAKWTKGPWKFTDDRDSGEFEIDMEPKRRPKGVRNAARILTWSCDIEEDRPEFAEARANFVLMTAAPELAAAVAFCRSVLIHNGIFETSERLAVEKAEKALRRAGLNLGEVVPS